MIGFGQKPYARRTRSRSPKGDYRDGRRVWQRERLRADESGLSRQSMSMNYATGFSGESPFSLSDSDREQLVTIGGEGMDHLLNSIGQIEEKYLEQREMMERMGYEMQARRSELERAGLELEERHHEFLDYAQQAEDSFRELREIGNRLLDEMARLEPKKMTDGRQQEESKKDSE